MWPLYLWNYASLMSDAVLGYTKCHLYIYIYIYITSSEKGRSELGKIFLFPIHLNRRKKEMGSDCYYNQKEI